MAPHIGVTSARARALHALAHGAARVVVASAAGAAAARHAAPSGMLDAVARAEARRQDRSRRRLAELLVDAGFTREDPATSTASSPSAAASSTSSRPARRSRSASSSSATRSRRCARYDPPTQRSIAPIDQVQIVPLRDVAAERRRGATIRRTIAAASCSTADGTVLDYAAERRRARVRRRARRRQRRTARRSTPSLAASHARGRAPRPAGVRAGGDRGALGRARGRAGARDAPRSARGRRRPIGSTRTIALPARQREHHGRVDRLGRRDRQAARARRDDAVRRRDGRPRRAHDRAAEGVRRPRGAGRARRGRAHAAVLVTVGALSRGFRLADAGLQIYRRGRRLRGGRAARRSGRRGSATKAFLSDLRDLKVGDYVVHVDHGIGMFVGLKQLGVGADAQEFLELRYAGDDKLFVPVERLDLVQKYTGGAQPRSSIGSAARPGRRRRRASRRRCATWPRSCSSSTPRARRCRATPSAPTRTGRRSSRTRSSTS